VEALQSNAIQIWLRLEEKLAAKPTDEVARWVHLNFMQRSNCGKKNIFPQSHNAGAQRRGKISLRVG
jgi:hypothetical protein